MPVGFVFDLERITRLRRAPQTVAGVLDLRPPDGRERRIRSSDDWRVRGYRIESRVIDGDGTPTGERIRSRATTMARDPLTGEMRRCRSVLTVVGWEDVTVYGDTPLGRYRALSVEDAVICGFAGLSGLRAAWRAEHPSAALARLYHVMMGDRRDKTVWLTPTWSMSPLRQGDYTTSASKALDRDAPLLTDFEYDQLGMRAQQRDTARRLAASRAAVGMSLADRAARLAS